MTTVLESGKYLTKVEREVIVWRAPDANGDGEPVWIDQTDSQGRSVGRMLAKDGNGKQLRSYSPPEGFQDRPSFDHTSNFVKVDRFGAVERQPNGEAICIKPGQAIVLNPDGSAELLDDEYAQYVFSQAHDSVNVDTDVSSDEKADDATDTDSDEESEEEYLRRRLAEIEEEKEAQK
jgi:hypothetical protein